MKEKRDNEAEHIEGRLSKNERIERQLNSLYDFRFNIVKSRTEYRAANTSGLYQPVTKFALNSLGANWMLPKVLPPLPKTSV